jgi:hypothetical protein
VFQVRHELNFYMLLGELHASYPGGGELSAPVKTGPGARPASYTVHTKSLARGQSGRGAALTTHPHLMSSLKKEWSYTSTPRVGLHGLF